MARLIKLTQRIYQEMRYKGPNNLEAYLEQSSGYGEEETSRAEYKILGGVENNKGIKRL